VVILTHVPPFPTTVLYNDKPCGETHLPHFANLSAGLSVLGIVRSLGRRYFFLVLLLYGRGFRRWDFHLGFLAGGGFCVGRFL